MLRSVYTPALTIMLLVGLAIGLAQWLNPDVPDLPALGLVITAIAPLAFLLRLRLAPPVEKRHPVSISASMGVGCAMIMIGIQRFGDDHRWLLILALLMLCAWMLYQRYHWRSDGRPPRSK